MSKTDGDGGDGDGDGGGGDVKQIENRASARPTRCFKLIRPGYIRSRTVDNLQTERLYALLKIG